MDLVVVTERRFVRDRNGRACCTDGSRAYSFWSRYRVAFDRVLVMARVADGASDEAQAKVEGEGVCLVPVADFRGLSGMVLGRRTIRDAISHVERHSPAFLLRVPGALGQVVYESLVGRAIPFGLEVVGDPGEVFASGTFRHPLRPLLRRLSVQCQRSQCRRALAVSYVTEDRLQRTYPPGEGAFHEFYSSVYLPENAFASCRANFDFRGRPTRIVTVGTMQQPYKGFHVLVDAIADVKRSGHDVALTIVGDGQHRWELETQAKKLGLSERVTFLGHLPAGDAVRDALDQADLFVLPSLTEGLPRAMIEAMARGLPCLGSNVGGIPELLKTNCLFPPDDARALAGAIRQLIRDPQRMSQESTSNLTKAKQYRDSEISVRRDRFYRELARRSQAARVRNVAA